MVREFKYLGVSLAFNNEERTEIQNRIQTANKAYYSILPLIKYRGASLRGRITLYKTLIRSIVMYGWEGWIFLKNSQKLIDNFERKILRIIFGPKLVEGKWRIRYRASQILRYRGLPAD